MRKNMKKHSKHINGNTEQKNKVVLLYLV